MFLIFLPTKTLPQTNLLEVAVLDLIVVMHQTTLIVDFAMIETIVIWSWKSITSEDHGNNKISFKF